MSDFKPVAPVELGTVSYAENERNVYKSVCVQNIEADTEVVIIPLARYLEAREALNNEAGFGVNEACVALGMHEVD